jgi:hypothetical protein
MLDFFRPNDKPMAKYYLRTIDCSDPTAPVASDPVNVPGMAVHLDGDIVLTYDPTWTDSDSLGTRLCSVRLANTSANVIHSIDLPAGLPSEPIFSGNALVFKLIDSGWYYPLAEMGDYVSASMKSDDNDTCDMGSFILLSVDISNLEELKIAYQDNYSGSPNLVGFAGDYLVAELWTLQAMVWQKMSDNTLVFKTVVDLPASIVSQSVSNGKLLLFCRNGEVLEISLP